MITAGISTRMFHMIVRLVVLAGLCSLINAQVGFTQEDGMKKEDFQVSVDGRSVTFTTPPISKMGYG